MAHMCIQPPPAAQCRSVVSRHSHSQRELASVGVVLKNQSCCSPRHQSHVWCRPGHRSLCVCLYEVMSPKAAAAAAQILWPSGRQVFFNLITIHCVHLTDTCESRASISLAFPKLASRGQPTGRRRREGEASLTRASGRQHLLYE